MLLTGREYPRAGAITSGREVVSERSFPDHIQSHAPRHLRPLQDHVRMGNPRGLTHGCASAAATGARCPSTTGIMQHPDLLLKHLEETFAIYV
jgi:hypothetical protein